MRVLWHAIHWRRVVLILLGLLLIGVLVPLVGLSYLDRGSIRTNSVQSSAPLSENEKIRLSVRSELRDLEKKRTHIRYEIDRLQQEWDALNDKIGRQQRDLNSVALSLGEAIRTRDELSEVKPAILRIPLSLADTPLEKKRKDLTTTITDCNLDHCFDYSRCPLKSYFQAFFYPIDEARLPGVSDSVREELARAIRLNPQSTGNPNSACVFIHFVSGQLEIRNFSSLTYWNGDGANHIIVILDKCTKHQCKMEPFPTTGRAIIARQTFETKQIRNGFDVVLPILQHNKEALPSILPARRKYLLTFSGSYVEPSDDETTLSIAKTSLSDKYISGLLGQFSVSDDLVAIKTNCVQENDINYIEGFIGQWIECEGTEEEPLSDATFSLIIAPRGDYYLSSDILTRRLLKILRNAAIPVILGDFVRLPFDNVLSWEKVAIILPKARATELPFLLKTYSDADIVALRRQGRRFYESYLASPATFVETLLSVLRYSLKMPAPSEKNQPSNLVANLSFGPANQQFSSETDEMLGPLETPYPSLGYQRNFSLAFNYWRDLFNADFAPHRTAPWRPDDPILPSDAKFKGSSFGFRPIGFGAGGSGKEFSEALGGNSPREQFTAVVLTYERQQVLLEGISSLKGLPYLNKVLVVWNGPETPGPETLTWPDIGVPVQVIKAPVNSLNNRFVPWDAIETEAVLSLDDDARLRHDELVFAFRVWREHRDRIVGFPGRFHAYDTNNKNWNYNSNHSCELSMVLTGASFFHKYYMYSYTHQMYPEIREIVDKLMNCEDIALNFLVSHLTRKPPIKVTSKWTFRCPGCPVALSEHDSHFLERHDCLNRFSQLYGYNPLLYTQLRADSVLFKTRVPHDKQKCFKYV